jgi:hypothetical protein
MFAGTVAAIDRILLRGGELDPMVRSNVLDQAAPMSASIAVVIQPGAISHVPWVDDPAAFAPAVGAFFG